ncbi:MAG TPA: hypothetical protein P5081_02785 [Phycisphaerae bacterium]|nr:hypothetical protein [Phycisphaerae bacterium]HRW51784.1 hypothetical protein [Phycisphaerae bacterium]
MRNPITLNNDLVFASFEHRAPQDTVACNAIERVAIQIDDEIRDIPIGRQRCVSCCSIQAHSTDGPPGHIKKVHNFVHRIDLDSLNLLQMRNRDFLDAAGSQVQSAYDRRP